MKALIKKHKKKSIASASVLATLVTILSFWGEIYPVVCGLLDPKHKAQCVAGGQISSALAKRLDNNDGTIQLDIEDDGGTP